MNWARYRKGLLPGINQQQNHKNRRLSIIFFCHRYPITGLSGGNLLYEKFKKNLSNQKFLAFIYLDGSNEPFNQ